MKVTTITPAEFIEGKYPKEVTEVEAIKVKVIKKKYVEQIMEPYTSRTDITQLDLLAYMSGMDAILARKANGHLTAIHASAFIQFTLESIPANHPAKKDATQYNLIRTEAYDTIHNLPQLFLD